MRAECRVSCPHIPQPHLVVAAAGDHPPARQHRHRPTPAFRRPSSTGPVPGSAGSYRARLQGHDQGESGYFTTIRAKFDLPTGVTTAQTYVYHCHIVEHEDNDMMLPFTVTP